MNSSPRTRRYFRVGDGSTHPRVLFSAHAEVFPALHSAAIHAVPLLRARGGISGWRLADHKDHGSSPRTRRYFRLTLPSMCCPALFSAHAEVFPGSSALPTS